LPKEFLKNKKKEKSREEDKIKKNKYAEHYASTNNYF